jgi:hypothetical protein
MEKQDQCLPWFNEINECGCWHVKHSYLFKFIGSSGGNYDSGWNKKWGDQTHGFATPSFKEWRAYATLARARTHLHIEMDM